MKTTNHQRPPAAGPTFYVLRFKHNPRSLVVDALFATRLQAESYLNDITSRAWNFVVDYATWQERERVTAVQGFRKPVPFADEPFWLCHPNPEHFPHISNNDPALLAYTESPEKGELDRQTPIKVGRYLKNNFPNLSDRQLTYYSEWFTQGDRPDEMGHAPLAFATTPDEIVDVYARGPHSCMRSKRAVAPYGAGDLAVAYLTDPDNADRIMARVLCWPEKKVYGRVYPTVDYYHSQEHDQRLFGSKEVAKAYFESLRARMRKLGWTDILEDGSVFDGARMLKMPVDSSSSRQVYRLPYLDNGVRFSDLDEDHWVLGADKQNSANAYGGTVYVHNNHTYDYEISGDEDEDEDDEEPFYDTECYYCEGGLDYDDSHTVYLNRSNTNGPINDVQFCAHCRDSRTFFCDHASGNYIRNDNNSAVEMADGETWHIGAAQQYGFLCPVEDEWHPEEDGHDVMTEDGSSQTWCYDAYHSGAFECGWNSVSYALTLESEIWPGFPASEDDNPDITAEQRAEHARERPTTILEQAA